MNVYRLANVSKNDTANWQFKLKDCDKAEIKDIFYLNL